MNEACNKEASAVQKLWREAKQACAEVEQRLGSIQRSQTQSGLQSAILNLEEAYNEANGKVRDAQSALVALANNCFE